MPRYLIYTTHTPEECVETLDSYLHAGAHYLTHADWGCEDGAHAEWLIVEAQNDADARLMVPPVVRNAAQVVRLSRYTPEQIRALHQEPGPPV
jgi:hypothetical protein